MAQKKNASKTQKKPSPKRKSTVKMANVPAARTRKLSRRAAKKKAKISAKNKPLPSAWSLLKKSSAHLYANKKLFLGILFVYGVLYLVLVRGLSANFQLASFKQDLTDSFSGQLGTLGSGLALFGLLLGSSTTTNNEAAGVYQSFLIITTSLAIIWALRHTYGEKATLRIRDAYYKSMQPLVPFIIVSLFIVLQLVPLFISAGIYSTVQAGGLAVSGVEQVIWLLVLLLGMSISLYFISSSLFALYIATLPNAQPRAALKAARKLVRLRRFVIIRKILFLPAVLLLFSAVVLIPLIIFFAPAAEVLFLLFSVAVIAVTHSYFYFLYRSLL